MWDDNEQDVPADYSRSSLTFLELDVIHFLIDEPGALGDRHADVRRETPEARTAAVDVHGSKQELIGMFEGHSARSHPASESAGYVQEAVVVFVGRVATHLEEGGKRLPSTVARLFDTLKTPSEQVQVAVSDCLAPLVRTARSDPPTLIQQLLDSPPNGIHRHLFCLRAPLPPSCAV
ncbi:unnamed protein product [Peniophora sp. CBMAI 1063]|nr:unnamed protein product [Peniophora sp. CBMAI 1063]